MKKFFKIISNIPCFVSLNNERFYVENPIFLEIEDENEIFFNAKPKNGLMYNEINFILNDENIQSLPVRTTKYDNQYKIELVFTCIERQKCFIKDNYELFCYNDYILKNKEKSLVIFNFKNNYTKLDIIHLNDNYLCICGYYKLKEMMPFDEQNQKIDFAIVEKNSFKIIHFDTTNLIEFKNNTLKIYTFLHDQNKQTLVAEFSTNANKFEKIDFYCSYVEGRPQNLTKKYQIAMAFFECILAGNTELTAHYLTDDLKSKITDKNLRLLFDNFIKADYEFTKSNNEINLIKHIKNNYYEATKYKIEFVGDKISNIISI